MGSRRTHRILVWIGTTTLLAASLSACGTDAKFVSPPDSIAKIALTPTAKKSDVPVSAELGISVTDGVAKTVSVKDDGGKNVTGALNDAKSAWVPAKPLKYDTTYTVAVDALDPKKIPATAKTSFTTMSKPADKVAATVWNEAGYGYGQAMPLMVDFPEGYEVPKKQRDDVEKRLFVQSNPVQHGLWHWFSGNHLEYRPKDFWEPGTTIKVRAALEGVPLGNGKYGDKDINRTVKIGKTARTVEISNKTKNMVAKKDGKKVKSMPISLGKPAKPSYSGTMTIMEQLDTTVFDTTAECGGKVQGENCYKTPVDWAQRLTWSGQFIHSAPWSVGDQGVTNVSHGCVNASPADSKWIFDFAKVGDPVVITGTEQHLPYGDGYSAYDLSWDDFQKGSYLPKSDQVNPDVNNDDTD